CGDQFGRGAVRVADALVGTETPARQERRGSRYDHAGEERASIGFVLHLAPRFPFLSLIQLADADTAARIRNSPPSFDLGIERPGGTGSSSATSGATLTLCRAR